MFNPSRPTYQQPPASPLPPKIDLHMHIYLMFGKLPTCPMEAQSLDLLEARLKVGDRHVEKVANYCFPNYWPNSHHHLYNDHDHRVHVTYGIHPNDAYLSNYGLSSSPCTMMEPRCVALGEVGLDFFRVCLCPYMGHGNSCVPRRIPQRNELLKNLLQIARCCMKPLVLHC